jgi:O-Antigen ligase/PDZ domain
MKNQPWKMEPRAASGGRWDDLTSVQAGSGLAGAANRMLILFLCLFALSVPHSIAVSQASAALALLAWLVRDGTMRRVHFSHTPIDRPLLLFALLTFLSALASTEPALSIPKLKTLLLFGILCVLATNLSLRGVRVLAGLLLVSSLAGVGFSLADKAYGRGMIVRSIEPDSPLAGSELRPGDVIWMIARSRVYSTRQAAAVIRRQPAGAQVNIETLRQGDPVEITLPITAELKARPNPLGVQAEGRSRQFRVSGFSRQFFTYAEQMQTMALFVFGGLLVGLRRWRRTAKGRLALLVILFALLALALALTATRAVIASFILAILLASLQAGGRLAPAIAVALALATGAIGFYAVNATRQQSVRDFRDDSTARRLAYMQAGLRLIPRHPWLGAGMDSHKRHWREWGFPGDYITHTHSTPIQLAMDRGLPRARGCRRLRRKFAPRRIRRAGRLFTQFPGELQFRRFRSLDAAAVRSRTEHRAGKPETFTGRACRGRLTPLSRRFHKPCCNRNATPSVWPSVCWPDCFSASGRSAPKRRRPPN